MKISEKAEKQSESAHSYMKMFSCLERILKWKEMGLHFVFVMPMLQDYQVRRSSSFFRVVTNPDCCGVPKRWKNRTRTVSVYLRPKACVKSEVNIGITMPFTYLGSIIHVIHVKSRLCIVKNPPYDVNFNDNCTWSSSFKLLHCGVRSSAVQYGKAIIVCVRETLH